MTIKRETQQRKFAARARIAKALAHPARLMILDALSQREMCVCELTDLAGLDQSTVSKHLAVLREAGFVEARRDSALVYYRQTCICLDGFFRCVEDVLRQNLKRQQAALVGS